MPVRITAEKTNWPLREGMPPRAAVSAFGISGANAHLIVEGYGDAAPTDEPAERETRFLPLSGKTDGALGDLAAQYISWLDERGEGHALGDMAWTAGVGRSHFDYRAGVVFRDAPSLRQGLAQLAQKNGAADGAEPQRATRVAFLYAGDAGRLTDMSRMLYDSEPIARAVLDRCDAVVRAERGASLLDVIFGRDEAIGELSDTAWAQPALYALQCALTALWESVGVRPNVALGTGTGELAAAQAAGVFSLEDGLRFTLARGTLMAALPGVDPNQALRGLEAAFAGIASAPPSLTLVSGVTGQVVDSEGALDGAYWIMQARANAALGACAATLAELGVDAVIEIGAAEIGAGAELGQQISREWQAWANGAEGAGAPLVIGGKAGFVEAVARAYEAGLALDFNGLFAGESRRRVSLPTYPFQRRRHWV